MQYYEAVSYLDGLRHLRPKLGTESTAALLAALGDPHEELTVVQIAGSNGKGSTARMLECVLREAGYDVGLYTSPDLNDFRERIRVNGRLIPKCIVAAIVESMAPTIAERTLADDAPTYFEAMTAIALTHFGRAGVDVAVLEVGIGGRYDATSVTDPVASAVTSVGLEHTDILGETIEAIARDKAQVAPTDPDRPLVTAATGPALEAIREETDVITVGRDGADVIVDSAVGPTPTDTAVTIDRPNGEVLESSVPLVGDYQAENAGVAVTLARQVAPIGVDDIERGLRKASWPGRFEVVDRSPLSILDGAHNPDACSTIGQALDRFEYDSLHLVFGAMRDKNVRDMRDALPEADSVALCRPDETRAESLDTLSALFEGGDHGPSRTYDSVIEAVNETVERAAPSDCVLITGSLSVVAEARDRWRITPVPKRVLPQRSVPSRTSSSVPSSRSSSSRSSSSHSSPSRPADRTLLDRTRLSPAGRSVMQGAVGHAVISIRLRPDQASVVVEELLRAGGEGVVADSTPSIGRVETVLAGTHAQFSRLVSVLDDCGGEFVHIVDRLDRILGDAIRRLDAGRNVGAAGDSERKRGVGGASLDASGPSYPWEVGVRSVSDSGVVADTDTDAEMDADTVAVNTDEVGEETEAETSTKADANVETGPEFRSTGAAVMGILNVTPDSFHDGGSYNAVDDAVARARTMIQSGADIIDIGGESTRPGADPVPPEVERDRVLPVVERLAGEAFLSVDTRRPELAREALEAGADIVNDVTGLENPAMRAVVAEYDAPVVLMHSIEAPVDPTRTVVYDDVVEDVIDELAERIMLAERAGIDRDRILVDPGLGFGKRAAESFELLDRLYELSGLGCPIVVGHSQKSMFDAVGREHGERLSPTIAGTALAVDRGADVVRVHEVDENVAAVRTAAMLSKR